MIKKLFSENQRLLVAEMAELQNNVEDEFEFMLEEMLDYDDFATGDNLQCVPTDPVSTSVVIKAGAVLFNNKIAWMDNDYTQAIDVPSVGDRYDIISATATEVDDDERTLTFIEESGGTLNEYTDDVDTRNLNKITTHYTKNTETVPSGHFPIAKIFVASIGGTYGTTEIEDIRPQKDDADLTTHRTAAVIDHPDGSIYNQHINNSADIALSKLNGLTTSTLETLVRYGFPLDFSLDFTYGIDDEITKIEYADGTVTWEADLTYDTDDFVEDIAFTYPEFNYLISLTKTGDNVTKIEGAVQS